MGKTAVTKIKQPTRISWEESFKQKIAGTVETLIYETTKHIGLVQKRTLKQKTHKEEIIAEAIRLVARELYQRPVTVTFPKKLSRKTRETPLRFVVSCERGESRLEVFPVTLEP